MMRRNFLLSAFFVLLLIGCDSENEITYTTVTFEDAATESLANSKYGTNLYGGEYPGFYDEVTDLEFGLLHDDLYNGGIFLSRWNDTITPGYTNQCSAYYVDSSTGYGGYNGSKTFAVHYGSDNSSYLYGSDSRTFIGFRNSDTEKVIDHFFVNNTTYSVLNMRCGDSFSSPLGYEKGDWFKLIVTGLDKNGHETKTVEFFLADFRNVSSGGIVTEWTKVDLHTLGAVNKLRFDLESSAKNDYGISVPAYFCFDDIAIRD
ncbi:MAG: DUF4465 domain-containing protein [Bacteroidales bacterium]|jgi:hypothetical protein